MERKASHLHEFLSIYSKHTSGGARGYVAALATEVHLRTNHTDVWSGVTEQLPVPMGRLQDIAESYGFYTQDCAESCGTPCDEALDTDLVKRLMLVKLQRGYRFG